MSNRTKRPPSTAHGDETTVNNWVKTIRRSRLDRTTKVVALTLATWADPDGTRVYPGVSLLAVACGLSYNPVVTALSKLRTAGLIRLIHKGVARHRADEYRLVQPQDLGSRIEVWTDDQMRSVADAMDDARRGKHVAKDKNKPILQPTPSVAGSDINPVAEAGIPVDNPAKSVDNPTCNPSGGLQVDPLPNPTCRNLQPTARKPATHAVVAHHSMVLKEPQDPQTAGILGAADDSAEVIKIPTGELAPVTNAGTIVSDWIDHCRRNGLELPRSLIARYGKGIKAALDQHFPPNLIKHALALMLDEGRANNPAQLDSYLVRAQTGPARRQRTLTPGEDSARRLIANSNNPDNVINAVRRFFDPTAEVS